MPPPVEGFAARLVLGPALRTQPDRRLVALVRDGYEMAFDEIVRRYGAPLRRYAAAIVGGRSEDVTQDAFSKALLALRQDGAEIELRPWLYRIVRNTALNDLRDTPPASGVLAEALAGGRNPAEELERREELADLIRQLQTLPESQRAAIVMRELEGLNHEEIAAALGISGGAARQAIHRARTALRDGLGALLPAQALKALLSGSSSSPVEAAAGAAGVGGAGVALKAATATVLVAGAVGAGVAIDHGYRHESPASAEAESIRADPSQDSEAGRAGLTGDNTSATPEHRVGSQDRGRGGGTEEQDGSIKQGDGRSGNPTHSSSGPGDEVRNDKGTNEPGSGGGTSGKDGGRDSDNSVDGSSGPSGDSGDSGNEGGSSNSGPGDDITASASDDNPPSGDSPDSNSGPDSGDDGAAQQSGSDDQRDPHGTSVFSVQETQP
jgi:RNA polymerase sigma factor (sigma-70 family)